LASLGLLYILLLAVATLVSVGLTLAGQAVPVIGYLLVFVWFSVAIYAIFFRKREVDRLLA